MIYGLLHVDLTCFEFGNSQLGTVSAYVIISVLLSDHRPHEVINIGYFPENLKVSLIVCRKPSNFSFILSNVVVDIVRVRINAIRFIFFDADVRTFEIRITARRKRNQNR